MFKLTIEKEAQDDLKQMIAAGGATKDAALRIAVFLQELRASQHLLSELLTRKFANQKFNVDKFVELYDSGRNFWRIALFEFDFEGRQRGQLPFRILYGYDQPCQTFRVLGVLPRDFNYDPNHELCKRILRTYDDLGMPKFRSKHTGTRGNSAA